MLPMRIIQIAQQAIRRGRVLGVFVQGLEEQSGGRSSGGTSHGTVSNGHCSNCEIRKEASIP